MSTLVDTLVKSLKENPAEWCQVRNDDKEFALLYPMLEKYPFLRWSGPEGVELRHFVPGSFMSNDDFVTVWIQGERVYVNPRGRRCLRRAWTRWIASAPLSRLIVQAPRS